MKAHFLPIYCKKYCASYRAQKATRWLKMLWLITLSLWLCYGNAYAQPNNRNTLLQERDAQTEHVFDIKGILQRGVLRVAMVAQDQVPFFYYADDGSTIGLDAEIATQIANGLGVNVEFNRTAQSFNDLIPKVISGEVDIVISKLSITSARAKTVIFSRPYILFRQALMLNRIGLAKIAPGDEQVANFVKRFNASLGIIQNSSYVAYSQRNFPNAKLTEYKSWQNVVTGVLKGDVLAGYRDEFEIKKIIVANPDAALRIKVVILKDTKDSIGMAISPKSTLLREWVNIYLEQNEIFYDTTAIIEKYRDEILRKN